MAENRARGRPDLADRIELRLAPSRLRQLLQVKVYHAVACAFEIYHALTVGNRNIVEECVATFRFSKVVHYASRVAVDYRKGYAEHFNDYSEE